VQRAKPGAPEARFATSGTRVSLPRAGRVSACRRRAARSRHLQPGRQRPRRHGGQLRDAMAAGRPDCARRDPGRQSTARLHPSPRRSFHGGQDAARQMLEAAEADLALEAGFVHVKARQAFPEIGRQVRRREQTAFRASRWRRRSCRALPDAPAPPKLRDRVRGWDLEFESGLLQR
jgi:hypothetical protein